MEDTHQVWDTVHGFQCLWDERKRKVSMMVIVLVCSETFFFVVRQSVSFRVPSTDDFISKAALIFTMTTETLTTQTVLEIFLVQLNCLKCGQTLLVTFLECTGCNRMKIVGVGRLLTGYFFLD